MKAQDNQEQSFGSLKGNEEMKLKAQLFQGWCVFFKALCYVVYVKFTGRHYVWVAKARMDCTAYPRSKVGTYVPSLVV